MGLLDRGVSLSDINIYRVLGGDGSTKKTQIQRDDERANLARLCLDDAQRLF